MSDSLRPHESQHTRPPCPSPTPRVYSNPCPSSRWCHPTIQSHYFMANSGGGSVSRDRLYFLGLQNHCGWWLQLWNEKTLAPWEKIGMTNLDSVLKSRDIILLMKVCIVKAIIFPVATYRCELDHKEGWTPKNWCCGAGEDSWESLGQQENQTSPS